MTYELVIGNKNYSSWSFRPWLAMRVADIPFSETKVQLFVNGTAEGSANTHIFRHSDSGRVPVLKAGDLTIWESLAILEFLAEQHPDKDLWPADPIERARARVIANEMHAGFAVLRHEWPMNMRRPVRALTPSPDCARDIARIEAIWRGALATSGGPFLFGQFGIADAMYAPVVNRFHVYGAAIGEEARAYMALMMALPAWGDWAEAARNETWVISEEEV